MLKTSEIVRSFLRLNLSKLLPLVLTRFFPHQKEAVTTEYQATDSKNQQDLTSPLSLV